MGMADLGWSTSKQCDFPTVKGNTIHIQTIQHMFHGPHGEKKGSPSPWFRAVEVMVVLVVVEVLVLVVVVVVVVN